MSPTSSVVDAWATARPVVRNRARWLLLARPKQLPPPGDWNVFLYLAGRNAGKTRSAAEDMAYWGVTHPNTYLAVVAPTYSAVRDVCIEGDSGLLSALPESEIEAWNRSLGELVLTNGTRYKCFSGDEPDRLRGFHHHRAWFDELAAIRYPDAWDQLILGLTLGEHPQIIVTTTPRPTALIKELAQRADVAMVQEPTWANAKNLSPVALASLRDRYGGNRLGRQELEAEILEDVEGALWHLELIEADRMDRSLLPQILRSTGSRTVVAIDPGGTLAGDETGIVAAARVPGKADLFRGFPAEERRFAHGFVLADRSGHYTPNGWAEAAVALYRELRADRIVAERNNGADMVENTIHSIAPDVPVTTVWASKGKEARAEPIVGLYEQHRIHHLGAYVELESEQTSWVPGSGKSPNRLDAAVYALAELLLESDTRLPGEVPETVAAPEPITAGIMDLRW